MARRQDDGSIQLSDGRVVFANSIIQGNDLLEILDLVVPLYIPPPVWPFISGGGGGGEVATAPPSSGGAGSQGGQGPQGPGIGAQGPQGPSAAGTQGPQGNTGAGVQGPQGNAGTGVQGPQGNTGAGAQGPQGNAGVGTQGAQGNQGDVGSGVQGPQGDAGVGVQGPQGDIGFQGPQGALNPDIFAATRVVSLVAGEGTDLTIAAAIAALPAAGGYIYVKEGTFPLAATLTMPDKPVVIRGSGDGTIISLGANAIPAFTIPDGLTERREYVFENFLVTGTSVANQRIWSIEDANAFGVVKARNVNSTGVQIPISVIEGIGAEPVEIHLDDCHLRPIADGSSILIDMAAASFFPTHVFMQRVWFYDELADSITGTLTGATGVLEGGIGIFGEDCVFSIGADSRVDGLALFDSHIYNLGGGANPVISVLEDSFGIIGNVLVGCTGIAVSFEIERCQILGGVYATCAFVVSALTQFIGAAFTGTLTADAAVIIGTGATSIQGCSFGGRGTAFVLDGNFGRVTGNSFSDTGGVYTAVIRTTNGTAIISDNRFPPTDNEPPILEAGTTSTNRIDNNQFFASPTLLAASDAVVNGFKRRNVTGQATVDALTAVFTHQNDKGLAGAGSIKNTGAASLTIRRTVTDGYGVTDFQEDVVLAGAVLAWPMDAAIGTALPSFVSFTVSVRSTTAGVPTTFDLRHSSTGAY